MRRQTRRGGSGCYHGGKKSWNRRKTCLKAFEAAFNCRMRHKKTPETENAAPA